MVQLPDTLYFIYQLDLLNFHEYSPCYEIPKVATCYFRILETAVVFASYELDSSIFRVRIVGVVCS